MKFEFGFKVCVAAFVFGLAGCAAPSESPSAPAKSSVVECGEVQRKVLTFDGFERNKLVRAVMLLSLEMGTASSATLESCLTAGLRIDCDSRSCLIREKYFVNDVKN